MTGRRSMHTRLFSAFLALLSLNSCSPEHGIPTDSLTSQNSTLNSLKKVDDFPLYTMTYAGDYGFADYLKTGTHPSLSLREPGRSGEGTWGCTCFAASGIGLAKVFGRNFDWHDCIPLLLFTKAPGAYASVSMVDLEYFGYSRNNLPDALENREELLGTPFMPFDGLNEKGVAIGMMAVPEGQAPYSSGKITIGEIQVIRLVLDYAADVNEALTLIDQYNVRMESPPIHYLVADRSGQSAVIEFVGGQTHVLRNSESWQVSTNFVIYGSNAPDATPCWRYDKAHSTLMQATGCLSEDSGLSLLQQVSQSTTVWSTLYNLESLHVLVAPGRKFSRPLGFSLDAGK